MPARITWPDPDDWRAFCRQATAAATVPVSYRHSGHGRHMLGFVNTAGRVLTMRPGQALVIPDPGDPAGWTVED